VDVYIVDPRKPLALWDNIRYRVRPATPVWILGRKKIFDGIPDLADLEKAIDAELGCETVKEDALRIEGAQT
jgi:hypothetical protein